MILLVICSFLIFILLIGHYGFPESKIIYQEPTEKLLLKENTKARPFKSLKKNDTLVLLVHGYEGTPYSLKELGNYLTEKKYDVDAILLAGHGLTEKEFSKTRYYHWFESLSSKYHQYRKQYKKVFIVGFSLGGNLSARLAGSLNSREQPDALVLISTPMFFNTILNNKIYIKDWRLAFSGLIKYLIPLLAKSTEPEDIQKQSPWVGYRLFYATACLHSFKKNVGKTRKLLKKVVSPLYVIQAYNDNTVHSDSSIYIYKNTSSPIRKLSLFNINKVQGTKHVITTHKDVKKEVFANIVSFLKEQ